MVAIYLPQSVSNPFEWARIKRAFVFCRRSQGRPDNAASVNACAAARFFCDLAPTP
jgi:hypothetical protein